VRASRLVLLVCAGAIWTQAAFAQSASEKRADIERLLAITEAAAITQQMSQLMTAQLKDVVRASNPNIPQQVLDALPEAIDDVLEENIPSLMSQMADIYDQHFTHEDIRALIGFYSSAVGRKLVEAQPAIAQQSAAAGQAWGMSLGPQIEQRIRQRLQDEGYSL